MADVKFRRLERSDYDQVCDLLIEFARFTQHDAFVKENYDRAPVKQLLLRCEYSGCSWVAQDSKGVIQGVLLSMRTPDLWIPEILRLRELAWFVREEYRNTTVGARLYSLYKKEAENQVKSGKISGFTLTKLAKSPDFDYEKGGFKFMEATYLIGA